MSGNQKCLTSVLFLKCLNLFIYNAYTNQLSHHTKNIHFSDKVGVGGSSPLNPTRLDSIDYLGETA